MRIPLKNEKPFLSDRQQFPFLNIQKGSYWHYPLLKSLNAFNLLPVPSRLWELPFSSADDKSEYPKGLLVRRPPLLRRSRLGFKLIPSGLTKIHSFLGVSGVKRGIISEFSKKSQGRLEKTIQSYNVRWNSFITLTFHVPYMEDRHGGGWDCDYFKRDELNIKYHHATRKLNGGAVESDFGQDINLAFSLLRAWVRTITESARFRGGLLPPLFIWKKEFTSRGVIHFHLLSTARLKCHVKALQKKWAELTGQPNNKNSCDIQIPKNQNLCGFYLAKYVSKWDKKHNSFCCSAPLGLCFNFLGRWWGVINRRAWKNAIIQDVDFPLEDATFKKLFSRLVGFAQREAQRKWLKNHRDLSGFVPPYQNLEKDKYFSIRLFHSDALHDVITATICNVPQQFSGGGWGFYDDVEEKNLAKLQKIPFWFEDDVLANEVC